MSSSASIQKMSHRHEEILNFLLSNPLLKMGEVAAHFGVTFPWLSTIVHSHAFQDQLKKRQDQVFDSAVLATIDDKIGAAAQVTLDAYLEKVPTLTADQLISANDKLLNKLGYGSRGNGAHIQINGDVQVNHVSKDILEEARNRIGTNKVGAPDSKAAIPDKRSEVGTQIEGVVVRAESKLSVN
jgi:hypothetical protein